MPKVISVANQKGGVGKSTVTILLASALVKQKKQKVLILDTDSQGSISQWLKSEQRLYEGQTALVEVEHFEAQQVERWLKRFATDYDIIFIDIPRMTNFQKDTATLMLLYMCNAVFIPVVGSKLDVFSTNVFAGYMQEAKEFRERLNFEFDYFGFINKDNNRTQNQTARGTLTDKMGIPVLDNSLKDLKLFTEPSLFESILDTEEGKRRFGGFFKEVCEKLKIK